VHAAVVDEVRMLPNKQQSSRAKYHSIENARDQHILPMFKREH
jgi:hypothetical protein